MGATKDMLKGDNTPIGKETMDAFLDVTDALLACVSHQFKPYSAIYRINDFGEYVSEKD